MPYPETAGESARLGAELREARQTLGLSVEDMAESLRIRRVYLAALEEGRVKDMPAPAYAVGFVRTYARALGLDDDAVVRRFRESTGAIAPRKPDLVFPEPVPERGMPAGAVLLGGALLAIGAYIGWYSWSGSGPRTVDAVPIPPPRIEMAVPKVDPEKPPIVGVPPAAGDPNALVPPAIATRPPPAAAAPVVTPGGPRIVLKATGDAWFMVRPKAGGKSLVNKVLRAGESYEVPVGQELMLSVGNIKNLEILVDGAASAGFVDGPLSRNNIPLDADRLKAEKIGAAGTGAAAAPGAAPGAAPKPKPKPPTEAAPRPRPRPVNPADRAYDTPG